MAWARGSEGRKHYCGTALYAAGGEFSSRTRTPRGSPSTRPASGPWGAQHDGDLRHLGHQTAVVTGASSGIGEATARLLAAAGFTVVWPAGLTGSRPSRRRSAAGRWPAT